MSKKVAILQSNYIPWKGYFDLINQVDEFVLYDTAQYTKNDWRNRNQIKTNNGLMWLTIPVRVDSLNQTIIETKIALNTWNTKHFKTLKQYYGKAQFYKEYEEELYKLYKECNYKFLSEINYHFIKAINKLLDINTKITWSHDLPLVDGKTERLVGICKHLNASEYISGPAAKNYLNESLFSEENISVSYINYSGYKVYNQLHDPFYHQVSIIDLILCEGPNARHYLVSKT